MSAPTDSFPRTGSATVHVLQPGYAREEADGEHVGSTVTLIRDGDVTIIVDPGLVASRDGPADRRWPGTASGPRPSPTWCSAIITPTTP